MTKEQFSSEGFDLDAMATQDGEVVYEIGGGASAVAPPPSASAAATEKSVTDTADDYKSRGNDAFREKNWLEAMDMYTAAIQSLPGMTAIELLEMREEWQKAQQAKVRERLAQEDEERRRRRRTKEDAGEAENDAQNDNDDKPTPPEPERFQAPPHVHSSRLAVLHANRAAALMQLEEFEKALDDCDVAILRNPCYVKALMRRATLHEKMDNNTEAALADAKMAMQVDPGNRQIRAAVDRLQKLEDERLEKLKAETMDKLKDLGNSILGNFGLSLDNFKAVQDPNTGSYSISFNQNT